MTYIRGLPVLTLKRKCCHFDEIFIKMTTFCTASDENFIKIMDEIFILVLTVADATIWLLHSESTLKNKVKSLKWEFFYSDLYGLGKRLTYILPSLNLLTANKCIDQGLVASLGIEFTVKFRINTPGLNLPLSYKHTQQHRIDSTFIHNLDSRILHILQRK